MAIKNQDYIKNLIRELISLPSETEWVEFKHNNDEPQMIGELLYLNNSESRMLSLSTSLYAKEVSTKL